MKLVVKLPEGKLPFIGVRFNNSWNASKTNEELIESYSSEIYTVKFEIQTPQVLHLSLQCKDKAIQKWYKDLEYEPEKLKRWMQLTRGLSGFNFGHTFMRGNDETIARFAHDLKRVYVLKVERYEVQEGILSA